jgi:hypothetical protein
VKSVYLIAAIAAASVANAADLHPIVNVQNGYLFGAVVDGKWIKADDAAKLMADETTYRVYSLTGDFGNTSGGKPKSEDAPCEETLSVPLSYKPDEGVIAVAGTWDATPRKVRVLDPTQKVYLEAVRDFLKTKEIKEPQVKIDNILRVDLDGDGEKEVLISATNFFTNDNSVPMRSLAGSYSMVILRRVVGGKVETQLVEGEFHPTAYQSKDDDSTFDAPNAYKVIAVLDLDGDGKLEIVVDSRYYEGEATTIYRCDPKKCEALLSAGCGA